MPEIIAATGPQRARLYFLDWLRILATLAIFSFHNSRFYDFTDWHIKNAQTSQVAAAYTSFMNIWMMPLFFALSGAAVYFSLRARSAREFLKERFWRIGVPWLVTGLFIIAPPQVYLERLTHGEFTGNFFQFIPHYFDGLYGFGGNFAFHSMHLWYLMQLSIFSVIALPLLLPGKTNASIITRLGRVLDRPWLLPFLFATLIIAVVVTSVAGLEFTEQMGSWDIVSYLIFFLLGYMLVSGERFLASIRKQGPWFLGAATALSVLHLYFDYGLKPDWYDGWLRGPAAWAWMVGLLWVGQRFLNFSNGFTRYVNEMVLPFYVLHQTVILFVGYFVIPWNTGIPLKYLVISSCSFVIIVFIYEAFIRRVAVLRTLFGMKPRSRPVREAAAEPEEVPLAVPEA